MRGCRQDPVHHGEGDVWIHTRMVCEALAGLDDWRALRQPERELVFAAALLHDVAKPLCTRTEDGRITSRGHSPRGAMEARRILWEHGVDVVRREQICAMVRYHQIPFFLIERDNAERMALLISQQARCDYLAMLAGADARGRICEDQPGLLLKIGLFAEHCRELGCLDRPWQFPSPTSRFEYFRRDGRDPHYRVHDDSRCEVILMSGLPGSGKDSWLGRHAPGLPVVSLDGIRCELGVEASDDQGEVVQAARDRAREFLRCGASFAWNATNLTREVRAQLIALFTGYRARARIVHIEAPYAETQQRNANRAHAVPGPAMARMLERWDVPAVTEAPAVEWWENTTGFQRLR